MVEENWKEKLIAEYVLLQKENENILQEMIDNQELSVLRGQYKDITRKIEVLKKPYDVRQGNIEDRARRIKELLIESWDIEGKTYECNIGTATLRTTKSLKIRDKNGLIGRLGEIFVNDIFKATECIIGFDLAKIRKYKEADLIEDKIAYYDEKKSVAIKITGDK